MYLIKRNHKYSLRIYNELINNEENICVDMTIRVPDYIPKSTYKCIVTNMETQVEDSIKIECKK